jgi:hypothetical protein
MAAKKKVVKRGKKKSGISPGLLVSDRVQIRDVRLMSCGCQQKPAAMSGKKSYDIRTSTDVRLNEDQGSSLSLQDFTLRRLLRRSLRSLC